MNYLQQEILRVLKEHAASYTNPLSSAKLSTKLNLNPAYLRFSMRILLKEQRVLVRRGKGGGYFLNTQAGLEDKSREYPGQESDRREE